MLLVGQNKEILEFPNFKQVDLHLCPVIIATQLCEMNSLQKNADPEYANWDQFNSSALGYNV